MSRVSTSSSAFVLVISSIGLMGGCALVLGIEDGKQRSLDGGGLADGAADGPAPETSTGPCDPTKPFGAPKIVAELNPALSQNQWATLSSDELRVVWGTRRDDGVGGWDLVEASRASTSAAFGAPVALAVNTTDNDEYEPGLTPDGRLLIYTSNDPRGLGFLDLWSVSRTSVASPFPALGPDAGDLTGADTIQSEYLPSLTASALYFTSNRTGPQYLYRAQYDQSAATVTNIASLTSLHVGSSQGELAPAVSADEKVLYFASADPTDGGDGLDIWVSTRSSIVATHEDVWPSATRVAELSSTNGADWPSWVSPDLCRIYITSDRTGAYAIYLATRSP